ncbi:MAG: extracellular solute-binding protein [Rickettsiales bacterium]
MYAISIMMRLIYFLCLFLFASAASAERKEAMVLFGEPKYKPGFTHFDYVNPDAPKGGTLRLAYVQGFDSLNPFILRGLPAPGLNFYFETLMVGSLDEPQTEYGLIAQSFDLAKDKKSIVFYLNPKARWQDKSPITAEDVIFSFNTLKEKGDPFYKLQYASVIKAEAIGRGAVKFIFDTDKNRDLPVILANMPVISKAYFSKNDFAATTQKPPLTSGPYKIARLDPGRAIVYERDPSYWGKDLPSRKGYFNFDHIRFDVYRDDVIALESLKAKQFDLYEEFIARNWATAYNIPAVERGELIKYQAPNKIPRGMQAFLFNTRDPRFSDRRVREAIADTLDFEWMNRTIFYDAYKRNNSFFQSTPFMARELPSKDELKLLEPYRSILPPEVFTEVYNPPVTDASGYPRDLLLHAQKLLDEAGWVIKEGVRVNAKTGQPLTIEFLVRQKTFERVVGSIFRNLKKLGIKGTFRLVDDAQYQKRLDKKDFDVISIWWNMGLVFPGNEQKQYWHSSQADIRGGMNYAGVKNDAIDALLDDLANAQDLASLTAAARALDRSLLWMHLVIPHWHVTTFRVAYWNKFEHPKVRPTYGLGFETWWMKPEFMPKPANQEAK